MSATQCGQDARVPKGNSVITHTITGAGGDSLIVVGERLTQLGKYIKERKTVIITDEVVYPLYKEQFPVDDVIVIGTGEQVKTFETLQVIYSKFLEFELDRSAIVVAVGGGIVSDIAGFAASTFLRGLSFGFVPTTLLAQVDASVGGKNGVNFQGYKNIVGVFSQPEFVLIDFNVLKTLEKETLGCGFAEAIKHGAIANKALFEFMEKQSAAIQALEPEGVERIVNDSIVIKSSVVNKDEKEKGERRKLNFGHTFGHALEKTLKIPHGEAVSIGMMVAAKLSQQRGYLTEADVFRLGKLLEVYNLPVSIDADKSRIMDAMRKDKKRYGDSIKFVLLKEIGNAIVQDVSLLDLEIVVESV